MKVLAPADLNRFACTGCGGCCKLWSISIDGDSFQRTKSFLENPPEPRPNAELPWYFEEDGIKYYRLTDAGSCVFLDKDNRCYLHKHDPALKSIICRDYPRGGVITPRGYEMSMSFSSYGSFLHVLSRAEPFSLVEAEMRDAPDPPKVDPVAVRTPRPYGWETYFLVEETLLSFLGESAALPLDDALIACAGFLAEVEQEDDGKKLRRKLRGGHWTPNTLLQRPPVSDIAGGYRLVEKILGLRAVLLSGTPPFRQALEQIRAQIDELQKGPLEDKVGTALFCRRLRRAFYDPARAELEPVIRKLLQYKIFQKSFFIHHGFSRGFNILCFLYAALRIRLMLRARKENRVPRTADLFDPIHFAEIHFAHSTAFLKFWKEVFQSNLLNSPALAEILVRI